MASRRCRGPPPETHPLGGQLLLGRWEPRPLLGPPGGGPDSTVAQDGAVSGPSSPFNDSLRGIGQECHTWGGGVRLCLQPEGACHSRPRAERRGRCLLTGAQPPRVSQRASLLLPAFRKQNPNTPNTRGIKMNGLPKSTAKDCDFYDTTGDKHRSQLVKQLRIWKVLQVRQISFLTSARQGRLDVSVS